MKDEITKQIAISDIHSFIRSSMISGISEIVEVREFQDSMGGYYPTYYILDCIE